MIEFLGLFFVCFWFNLPFWFLILGMNPGLANPTGNMKGVIACLIAGAGVAGTLYGAVNNETLVHCISRGGITALGSLCAYLWFTNFGQFSKRKNSDPDQEKPKRTGE